MLVSIVVPLARRLLTDKSRDRCRAFGFCACLVTTGMKYLLSCQKRTAHWISSRSSEICKRNYDKQLSDRYCYIAAEVYGTRHIRSRILIGATFLHCCSFC